MLLGEGPGAEEETNRRSFVGAAGKELEGLLHRVGHTREEVYIANTVKCRPPGNRTPVTSEVNACFAYLAEEIAFVQPKVILCLGGAALKALTGKDGVAANRGKPIACKPQVRLGEAQIFVTYHPAATLHNRSTQEQARIREAIAQDLELAFSLIGEKREAADHKKYLLPEGYSARDIRRGLDALMDCKVLACDLEWTALKDRGMSWPWSKGAELFSVAFSGRKNGNILSLSFSWPPPAEAEEDIEMFFECKPVVFHNALADLNWLDYLKIPTKLAGDTLILAHLMDEEQRLALDQLAPLYTDVKPGWKIGPWDKRPTTKEGWLEMLGYNANDTYATLKLAEALHARLESLDDYEKNGIKRVYYKLLLPVIPTMVSMALVGIPMDEEGVERELRFSERRTVKVAEDIAGMIGGTPRQAAMVAGSPTKTLDYLKRSYGLEIDSSRKDDLTEYEDNYPIIKLIQKYRWERNKVQGTYLGPWLELLKEQGDGRLHSVYRLANARTGRTSAEIEKGGSLQLMPRNQNDREIETRNLVRAREGYQIVAADYSQIELRVMAWFSGDQNMTQLFKEGADLHAATAAFVKANPMPLEQFWPQRYDFISKVTKDERQGAKGVNFGLVFGLQPLGLVDYARSTYKVDMSLPDAVSAHEAYFKMYYGVKAYHDYCRTFIFQRGYTETPFGRFRRHFEDPNKCINTPVQSTASDMTLFAMHNLDLAFKRSKWPAYVCGFVHDSVICEVQEDYVDDVKKVMKVEMENLDLSALGVTSIPVPLVVDIAVGKSWGEAK